MSYIDGCVIAVPTANKALYLDHARLMDGFIKAAGAISIVETWGDDIPEGKVTDFKRAVLATDEESIVFSWITWPDKATRDAAWAKMMQDPEMMKAKMPFDGKRMIMGGFEVVLEV